MAWAEGYVGKDVVRLQRVTAFDSLATNNDPTFREVDFLAKLRHQVPLFPFRTYKCGGDELGADVRFGERFFVHAVRPRSFWRSLKALR